MKLVICTTGMPGSGKSVVAQAAKELSIPVITLGDVVREEAKRLGIEITTKNLLDLAKKLREKEGKDAIVKRVANKIKELKSKVVLVDGIRNIEEVDFLRNVGKVIVIAVHASPQERFKRLIQRGREGDPKSFEDFKHRDEKELSLGIGKVIALADYILINEDMSELTFKEKAKDLLNKLIKKHLSS